MCRIVFPRHQWRIKKYRSFTGKEKKDSCRQTANCTPGAVLRSTARGDGRRACARRVYYIVRAAPSGTFSLLLTARAIASVMWAGRAVHSSVRPPVFVPARSGSPEQPASGSRPRFLRANTINRAGPAYVAVCGLIDGAAGFSPPVAKCIV